MKIVLTCEHGGNIIPKEYESLFSNQEAILNSHRGYDLGALDVFKTLEPIADFSKHSITSRLLIELNRSLHHKCLFSEFTKNLSKPEKNKIINQFYKPYRDGIEAEISKYIKQGETVVHISVHSFTPVWKGLQRSVEIGLLYDSRIQKEKQFSKALKLELINQSNYKIRLNQPYLGKSDGFTTYLRKQFPINYIGVEIEINQKFYQNNKMPHILKQTILECLGSFKQKHREYNSEITNKIF